MWQRQAARSSPTYQGNVAERVKPPEALPTLPEPHAGAVGAWGGQGDSEHPHPSPPCNPLLKGHPPVATRSVLSRAATDDTQKGCSRPGSPRSPWASRCRASGRFLERPHKATELWTEKIIGEGPAQGRTATRRKGTTPPHGEVPGGEAGSGRRHPRGSPYPSSAPDTMCSSLISWMLSMEPLAKGAVRGTAPPPTPSPSPSPHGAQQIALLVAVEDKLGLLGDLPHTHRAVPAAGRHAALPAQGVQRSHGILVPEAGGGRREAGVTHACTGAHIRIPSPRAHSQRLHVGVLRHVPHLHRAVVGRAVELVGASAERQPLRVQGEGAKGALDYSRRDRSQAREDLLKSRSQLQTSERPPLPRQALSLPALPIPSPPLCPLQCPSLHQSTGSPSTATLCLGHPIVPARPT